MKRKLLLLSLILFCLTTNAVHVVFRLDDPSPVCDSVSMRVVQLFNAKHVLDLNHNVVAVAEFNSLEDCKEIYDKISAPEILKTNK